MILSFEKIKKCGIYTDYTKPSSFKSFQKYNLFYGWNGSGKSTLSRLFEAISRTSIPEGAEVGFVTDEGRFDEKNIQKFTESIAVFNEEFIKHNIDWDSKIESILLLSEDRIVDIEELKSLRIELDGTEKNLGLESEITRIKQEHQTINRSNGTILTNAAKKIKDELQVLSTADSYYLNYDKRRVQKFIEDSSGKIKKKELMLTADEIEVCRKKASPLKKNNITRTNIALTEDILCWLEKIYRYLSTSITAKIIEELRGDNQVSSWVEHGLSIHRGKSKCAFCGGELTKERITELDAHFNTEVDTLRDNLISSMDFLNRMKNAFFEINLSLSEIYPEYKDDAQEMKDRYNSARIKLITKIDELISLVNEKKENIFSTPVVNDKLSVGEIDDVILLLEGYNTIIDKHNRKNTEFDEVTSDAKKKLEGHYICEFLITASYFSEIEKERRIAKEEDDIREKIEKKRKRIAELEAYLSNETLGAEQFNERLERFLGYGDIKLFFDSEKKGYVIERNGEREAKHLSEGEKTAVAFLYFLTKLHENGKTIENQILVIDDPISSFDSNKIFHAYALLKQECKSAKQLFVLTHNYSFYSLMLGWFSKESRKEDGKKLPNFCIYRIEVTSNGGQRCGAIYSTGAAMTQSSEYDYIFYSVYKYKDSLNGKDEIIFVGNIARKLVESFLSFKFPLQRGDLQNLLDAAYKNESDNIEKDEIYRFINIYSHHKKIDVCDQIDIDILESTYSDEINKIFNMMKRLDSEHFDSMEKWAKQEMRQNL